MFVKLLDLLILSHQSEKGSVHDKEELVEITTSLYTLLLQLKR